MALAAEPAPQLSSLVRGQRKSASSFFKELREELQCAPAVTSTGSPLGPEVPSASVSPPLKKNRERVQVVEFHSRNKKRKQKPDQEENRKVTSWLVYVYGENPDIVMLGEYLYRLSGVPKSLGSRIC